MDFNENKPIYLQITDAIVDGVISGEYPEGERLPSVREYAVRVEVNANTVMRSYEWLQQQRVIFNKRGIGFFVSPEARKRAIEMRRNIFMRDEAEYFFGRIASMGIDVEELGNLYRDYLEGRLVINRQPDQQPMY